MKTTAPPGPPTTRVAEAAGEYVATDQHPSAAPHRQGRTKDAA